MRKTRKETKLLINKANELVRIAYGLAPFEHYADCPRDPVFYHPDLDIIKVWAQFNVLMPENYGWIEIGEL